MWKTYNKSITDMESTDLIWFGLLKENFNNNTICRSNLGEQEWRSGESARLPPMCPGFDSRTWRHIWVEFVVGSLLCSERFFSGYSGFPLSSKTNISKFQFDPGMHGHFWTSSCELLGASWVNKLHLHYVKFKIIIYYNYFNNLLSFGVFFVLFIMICSRIVPS